MPTALDVDQQEAARLVLAAVATDEADNARLYARRMRNRAELDRQLNTGPDQFGVIELAGTARIGQGRAATQLSDARRLDEVLTGTLALLAQGGLFQQTAELLLSLTRHCTPDVQAEVEARVLTQVAPVTTTDARRIIERAIPEVEADLDPQLTKERLERARRQRAVWISARPDAMVQIGADLDVLRGHRWSLDFEELVRAQKVADRKGGVERSQDQRRADVFAELPGRHRALIQAIQQGQITELLAIAQCDPELAEQLEAVAASPAARPVASPADDLAAEGGTTVEDITAQGVAPVEAEAIPEAGAEAGDSSHHSWTTSDRQVVFWDDLLPTTSVPPEPPPKSAPRDRLAGLSVEELTVELLRLPVKDPTVLNVHIPMSTVLELDHRSGYLEGIGPVPAEHCRLLLPVAGLRRLYVDQASGVPLGIDKTVHPPLASREELTLADPETLVVLARTSRDRLLSMLRPVTVVHDCEPHHDPSPTLSRTIAVRDMSCIGIGCNHPARRCDDDHDQRYPDGPTAYWNLSNKSRRCHRAKHQGWTVERHADGHISWTSPLGHTYVRPGVWQAPTALPEDVTLPPPRAARYDDHDPHPLDGPLWNEPGDDKPPH
ncbi:MAG: hypothetical protein JWM02_484 [Frankiales bacterium]|nr:hypothetical protein [Frankiales bacterium]